MKIIISPAKKMEENQDIFEPGQLPGYIGRTEILYQHLKRMTEGELQKVFKANDQITRQNYERYQSMDIRRAQTPALLSYVGIQYQYMAPQLFSYEQWEYAKEHLRILSGFYGILKPCDRVTPYRLEMQTKLAVDGAKDLYEFWGKSLYDALVNCGIEPNAEKNSKQAIEPNVEKASELALEQNSESIFKPKNTIINLASKEYSKAIEPYLTEQDRYITCIFGVLQDGKVKVKATEAKMARGEMVRFMAENHVKDIEELKQFDRLGYQYSETHSNDVNFVYIKK